MGELDSVAGGAADSVPAVLICGIRLASSDSAGADEAARRAGRLAAKPLTILVDDDLVGPGDVICNGMLESFLALHPAPEGVGEDAWALATCACLGGRVSVSEDCTCGPVDPDAAGEGKAGDAKSGMRRRTAMAGALAKAYEPLMEDDVAEIVLAVSMRTESLACRIELATCERFAAVGSTRPARMRLQLLTSHR